MLAAAPLLSACGGALFACENADECAGAGAGGLCEADGWCSFDDDACPSGRRYGEHVGEGKAGECVDEVGTTTGIATTASTTDPTTTTTVDPGTTTTVDPTMASLEGTVTSDGESTSTLDASSSESTTDDTSALCGNDILDAAEDCEGAVPPGVDCQELGWVSGSLSCVQCAFDTSACVGCGPDGCSFDPCNVDDPRGCTAGESCIELLDGGLCTGSCTVDAHCTSARFDAVCYMMNQPQMPGTCLPSCVDGPCPNGMTCVELDPAVCVFL